MQAYVQKQNLTFPILLDEDAGVARRYGVYGIPASFFIDREGVIRAQHIGPVSESLIAKYLEPIL